VTRFSCILNNNSLHGILCAYLKEKGVGKSPTLQELAEFLLEGGLETKKDIEQFGKLQLAALPLDSHLNEIFQQLEDAAGANLMEVYQKFLAAKADLKLLKADDIEFKSKKRIEQYLEQKLLQLMPDGSVAFAETNTISKAAPVLGTNGSLS